MNISIGKPVDEFSATATNSTKVSLSGIKDRNNIVLFFYPKDDTPGCTSEGQAFSEQHDAFLEANTQVFGVSQDDMASHNAFRKKFNFPFELISDTDGSLCQLFDVIRTKTKDGEEFLGIERSTFLIDKDGILQHEWRRVKIKNHVVDVLQAAQALSGMLTSEDEAEEANEKKQKEPSKS